MTLAPEDRPEVMCVPNGSRPEESRPEWVIGFLCGILDGISMRQAPPNGEDWKLIRSQIRAALDRLQRGAMISS